MPVEIIKLDGASMIGSVSGEDEDFNFDEWCKQNLPEENLIAMQEQAKKNEPIIQEAILRDKAKQARSQRDQLLYESDWTQIPDARGSMSEEKANAWAQYRTLLRNLPLQEGFPLEIDWPEKPS